VEQSNHPEDYGFYLNDLTQFTEADEKPLLERIEQSNAPLLRYWRWPHQARSALSITGDIDSITLIDFVLRIFENFFENLKWISTPWSRFTRKVHYANLYFKLCGPKAFFRQLMRQIYSRDVLYGLEKDLNETITPVASTVEYSLRHAKKGDLEEVLTRARTESKESSYELIQRKWFYESGYHDCYVGTTADGDLCHIQWLVSTKADGEALTNFHSRMPRLEGDEILTENVYTFEKYRRNRVMLSIEAELCKLARDRGYNRIIGYVRRDNVVALEAFNKSGFRKFEEVPELKFLFLTRRKHD
jgi:hypothetical protein